MAQPYQDAAARTAQRYKIPKRLFFSLIHQESGWQPHIKSSAGAVGLTQLMPATAASLKVNPEDPLANLDGGARYLRQQFDRFGSWKLALAAYNAGPGNVENGHWQNIPETANYVRNVLGNQSQYKGSRRVSGVKAITTPPSAAAPPTAPPTNSLLPSGDPIWGTDLVSKTAFENLGKIAHGWKPSSLLGDLVEAGQQQAQVPTREKPAISLPKEIADLLNTPTDWGDAQPAANPAQPSTPTKGGKGKGKVLTASGADRPGVTTKQAVRDFVATVAAVHGAPLTITTGTAHNQYVKGENHVQSQHWTGDAADILFGHGTGPDNIDPALTKLGQQALIAAGADPAWAHKQTGGAYNVGGHNILFNTLIGGNHYNHLHVGV